MWTCSKCQRIFKKTNQPHSCQIVPLVTHFINKDKAKELFDYLVDQINDKIGKVKIISLPCCIHLFSNYDFLAALPKKDRLEIRFNLNRTVQIPSFTQSVPVSSTMYKNCFSITTKNDVNKDLLNLINEAYQKK